MLLDQKQQDRKEQMVLSIQQNQRNNQYGPVVEITLEIGGWQNDSRESTRLWAL